MGSTVAKRLQGGLLGRETPQGLWGTCGGVDRGALGGRSGSLNQQLWPVIVLTREQLPLVFKHWLDLLVGQGGGAAKGLAPWLEDGREGPMGASSEQPRRQHDKQE